MRQAEEAAAHGCMKDFCDITRKLAGKFQKTSSQVKDTKANILTKEEMSSLSGEHNISMNSKIDLPLQKFSQFRRLQQS